MNVATVVVSALSIVAQAAPGILSALSGKKTDDEAIAEARASLDSLHPVRVAELAAKRRRELETSTSSAVADVLDDSRWKSLRGLVRTRSITTDERAALRALLAHHGQLGSLQISAVKKDPP